MEAHDSSPCVCGTDAAAFMDAVVLQAISSWLADSWKDFGVKNMGIRPDNQMAKSIQLLID